MNNNLDGSSEAISHFLDSNLIELEASTYKGEVEVFSPIYYY